MNGRFLVTRESAGVLAAAAAVAGVTALLVPFRSHLALLNVGMLYLVLAVAVALRLGLWPAVMVSVLSNLALNFFFVPPFYRLSVSESGNLIALVVFLIVSVATGALLSRAHAGEETARRRQRDATALYEMSRIVLQHPGSRDALPALCRKVREAFRAEAVSIYSRQGGTIAAIATDGGGLDIASGPARAMVEKALTDGAPAFLGPSASRRKSRARLHDEFAGPAVFVPIAGAHLPSALVVAGNSFAHRAPDDMRLLEAFTALIGLAMTHARLISEATEARALREADELKSALLAAVSHDLRTPLAAIKASVTGLLDPAASRASDSRAEFLATINEETDRLTRLVTNLLDASRIEGGALRPEREWFDLGEVLEPAIERLRGFFPSHLITFESDCAADVHIDHVQIAQVVCNLVENAANFAPAGTVIRVRAASGATGAEIRVDDEGPGIPASERARVFERFFRGSTKGSGSGVGLGLAVARGFVEAHGGTICAVEPSDGSGACLVVRLPAVAAPEVRRVGAPA